jgi:hypothetical protein
MEGLVLCAVALIACFLAGRRSVVTGFGVLMTIGYAYGIIRANIPQPAMHFLFDFGVFGFYLALISRQMTPAQSSRLRVLQPWLAVLAGWPIILFLFPVQDPLIQLVGLRGQIFFLGFLAVGALLELEDFYLLARWFAVLNLAAFGFAVAEYFKGIESFMPRNSNTTIIYQSNMIGFKEVYRIPSIFTSSAAYSGTMVMTTPLLLGAWVQRRAGWMNFYLFSIALVGTGLGVFLGASRSHAAILFLMFAGTLLMGRISLKVLFRCAFVIVCVGWVVANNPRLQRFTELQDTEMVADRVKTSVNESFWGVLVDYPMGNGLGGGGTSIPFFLQDRITNSIGIENEYALMLLEEGIPGLLIWISFLVWAITSRLPKDEDTRYVGLALARAYAAITFGTAMLGTGILTAIPGTPIVFLYLGWMSTARISAPAAGKAGERARVSPTYFATNRS